MPSHKSDILGKGATATARLENGVVTKKFSQYAIADVEREREILRDLDYLDQKDEKNTRCIKMRYLGGSLEKHPWFTHKKISLAIQCIDQIIKLHNGAPRR